MWQYVLGLAIFFVEVAVVLMLQLLDTLAYHPF